MNKGLHYYLLYIDDIRSDLGITVRRKVWKHKAKVFRSLAVLLEILEEVTNEALTSELLNQNDKEEIQREVITLLKQFELARKTLTTLVDLQCAIPPLDNCYYKNLNWGAVNGNKATN